MKERGCLLLSSIGITGSKAPF